MVAVNSVAVKSKSKSQKKFVEYDFSVLFCVKFC